MTELLPPLPEHLQKNLIGKSDVSNALQRKCVLLQIGYANLPNTKKSSLYGYVGASNEVSLVFKPKPTLREVIDEYCHHIEIPYETLVSRSRKREEVIKPRQIIMHFLAVRINAYGVEGDGFKTSLHRLGDILGKYDHATVLHARNVVEDLINVYPDFKRYYQGIENHLCAKFGIK